MYLRHEQISEDPIFVSYIPRVIGIAKKKLGKVSYRWQSVADSFRALACSAYATKIRSNPLNLKYSQPEF